MKFSLVVLSFFCFVLSFGQYNKPMSPAEEKKGFAKLEANYAQAKAKFVKNPKDAAAKHAYVESNAALGLMYTYSNTVDRRVKYKKALTYLREALKYEPKHKVAKPMYDQIVSIYKSMNRPVPGG